MKSVSTPLAIAFSYLADENTLAFITRDGECRVGGNVHKITAILKHCNGISAVSHIAKLSNMATDEALQILNILEARLIVIESKELYKVFHRDASNISPYQQLISPTELESLTQKNIGKIERPRSLRDKPSILDGLFDLRDTTRKFSDKALTVPQLFFVLENMYRSSNNMATPSAGSIYASSFFVVLLKSIGQYPPGLYAYDYQKNKLIYKSPAKEDNLKFVLGDMEYVNTASLVIFITSDLARITKKYANRGYYYALIEAGHIAQNIQLACAEKGIGVLEYGAILNEMADKLIRSEGEGEPTTLLSMIVGNKSHQTNKSNSSTHKILWNLVNNYVGENNIIRSIDSELLSNDLYTMPRHASFCSYGSREEDLNKRKGYSFAADYSRSMALIKAMAEAVERYYAGEVSISKRSSYARLVRDGIAVLDPTLITYSSAVSRSKNFQHGFIKYNQTTNKAWVTGLRLRDDSPIEVLAEQVYYPLDPNLLPGKKRSHKSNSSGVAAGFTQIFARTHALLELIERDAFAIFWYSKPSGSKVRLDSLPGEIAERIESWRKKGGHIDIIDITTDSTPVVLATLRLNRFPYLATGCASKFSFREALIKALDEMESTAISWMDAQNDINISIKEDEVKTPRDHGIYYAAKESRVKTYVDIIDKLEYKAYDDYKITYSQEELIAKFNPVEVVLHKPVFENDFWVVRLMSENLVMINFGQGNDPTSHPRLLNNSRVLRWGGSPPLHFFP